jgi:phage tail-like protein
VNLTLKRGYSQDKALWQWYQNILNGIDDRRNVTVVLLNERRQPVLRWHAENAWINKIEGPALKASSNDVAMESLELVHEGLSIEM